MPAKGRVPPFFVVFVFAFAFVGLVGFRILKERKTASANISEKKFALENIRQELLEQSKLLHERERERDFAQTKLLELERMSLKAEDSLKAKDAELQNVRAEYNMIADNFKQLKKISKQKDDEIVHIRQQLQEYSFEKAKESAEQISNNHDIAMESVLEKRQAEEHKPADEAGLDDRKGLQELEEAAKDGYVSALEKEMDERSKPKTDVLNEGEINKDKIADEKTEEFSSQGELQDEESDEQDDADRRVLDGKEIETSQDEDQHEDSDFESHTQTGDVLEVEAQGADHDVEA